MTPLGTPENPWGCSSVTVVSPQYRPPHLAQYETTIPKFKNPLLTIVYK